MKKIPLLFTSLVFVSSQLIQGQDTSQLDRAAYTLKVQVDKKSFYEEEIKAGPYILPNNTIQLYPGETVYIEIDQADGIIKGMKSVKEIKDVSKTVTISFTQNTNKKVHESMMLKIVNPLKYRLSYKASIFLFEHKRWVKTNVYPVQSGLSGFETWPDIITSIGVGAWVLEK